MPHLMRRFPWWLYGVTLGFILVFTAAPIISVMIAGGLAESHGCTLNEGSTHSCMIAGTDWGSALYTMFVLGWLMLLTLPLGAGALFVWIIVLIVHYFTWRRFRRPSS